MSTTAQQLALRWLTRKLERISCIDEGDREALAFLPVRVEGVPRSRRLLRQGERPHDCCLLVDGVASRYKDLPSGQRQIVSFHVRGDILDTQHALLPRADHNLEALTDATVGWVDKSKLLQLAWERPAIGKALWRDCLIDASIFREWLLNVGRRDAKSRIAHLICEFATRCSAADLGEVKAIAIPMTQEQIADATGLSSVHVNRMVQDLRSDGAITRTGKLQVASWDRLCSIANFDPAYLDAAA